MQKKQNLNCSDKWKVEEFHNPSGKWIIRHFHYDRIINGSIVWPHNTPSLNRIMKYHCMDCGVKAPNHLIIQMDLLNGT